MWIYRAGKRGDNIIKRRMLMMFLLLVMVMVMMMSGELLC